MRVYDEDNEVQMETSGVKWLEHEEYMSRCVYHILYDEEGQPALAHNVAPVDGRQSRISAPPCLEQYGLDVTNVGAAPVYLD